jgi:hypothetical protein
MKTTIPWRPRLGVRTWLIENALNEDCPEDLFHCGFGVKRSVYAVNLDLGLDDILGRETQATLAIWEWAFKAQPPVAYWADGVHAEGARQVKAISGFAERR